MAISLEFFITHRSPDEANREETVASETKATIDQNFALSDSRDQHLCLTMEFSVSSVVILNPLLRELSSCTVNLLRLRFPKQDGDCTLLRKMNHFVSIVMIWLDNCTNVRLFFILFL